VAAVIATDHVVVKPLDDTEFELAMAMLASEPTPEEAVGDVCPACGETARNRGHYRVCARVREPNSAPHNAEARAVHKLFCRVGVPSREARRVGDGSATVLDDGHVGDDVDDVAYDFKCLCTTADSWDGKYFRDVAAGLREELNKKFTAVRAGEVHGIINTIEGRPDEATLDVIDRLEAIRARADPEGFTPSVAAAIGTGLLRQQSDQYKRWLAFCEGQASAAAAGHRAARTIPAGEVSA
jgi:hypothetical protein